MGPRSAVVVVVALTSAACGDVPTGVREVSSTRHVVEVLGTSREYRLIVPEGLPTEEPPPLLLIYHGATQTASGIELMSWFWPVAEAEGVVVAFPEAAGDYWNTPASPASYWSVPDVPFADAVIKDVAARVSVDRGRVFAAGFSNGGVFAQVLGCLRSTDIAGIAVVGAGVSGEVAEGCPWERPMPVTVFLGDRDPQFFWDDGLAAGLGMLGGGGSAAWLASLNGCPDAPRVVDLGSEPGAPETSVERWEYRECTGAPVDFYRIRGGGHTWPGSPINVAPGLGRKTHVVDATRAMVRFFLESVGGGA